MAALFSLIGGAWPTVIGLLAGVIGIVYGLFKHKAAQVATAKAKVADMKLDAVAADQKAEQAAKTALDDATQQRAMNDAQIAAMPVGEAEKELRDEFSR